MSVAEGSVSEVQGVVATTLFLPDGGFAVAQRIQGKSVITVRPVKEKAFRPLTPPNDEFILGGAVSRDGTTAHELATQLGTALTWRKDGVSFVLAGSVPTAAAEAAARELG